MLILQAIIAAIIGLFVGGVLNVLADDLPYRRNPSLPTYNNGTERPVTAWLGITAFLLGQREPTVKHPNKKRRRIHRDSELLSWRHPITEVATAILLFLTVIAFANIPSTAELSPPVYTAQLIFYLAYVAILVLITVIDIEHKLILFVVIIPSIVLALLDSIILPQFDPQFNSAWRGALAGFGLFFAFYLGGYAFNWILGRIQKREINTVAFGYGDVMLITFTGAVVGLANIPFAIFTTVFFGALGAIIYLITKRISGNYEAFTALPYGPYIVAGTLIMMLYAHPVQCSIWNWSTLGPC